MRTFILFILLFLYHSNFGQSSSTFETDTFQGHTFFHQSNPENKRLILFLHGGINNPLFDRHPEHISTNTLFENNSDFPNLASAHQFDIIAPLTDTVMDWLNDIDHTYQIIQSYIKSLAKPWTDIYISGFSDGGTGSYKIFYAHPTTFSGLIVFNGYPQHTNYYKQVDYSTITNKKIIFCSTFKDKTIPYEFLLTEYCKQKPSNANTYFYVTEGDHQFSSYTEDDLLEVFAILTDQVNNTKKTPIQGFVKNDSVVVVYPYRKSIVKKYNYGIEVYNENKNQMKTYH